ncbi:MAG: hypothetical protein ACK2UQ_04475 [Anaerolineae bacterium]|jgi:predicted membrane protein
MTTLAKDLARGCKQTIVIRIISIVIGLPIACIYVFGPLWFISSTDFQLWAIIVAVVIWLVPILVGGVGFPVGVALWRKAKLDALFLPLGLTGKAYQTRFRQYHGVVQGKQVDVFFYRGPVLEIEVKTTLQTRIGVTNRQSDAHFFADLFGHQPIVFNNPTLSDLTVFAADEAWAKSLLATPNAAEFLHRLVEPSSNVFTRQQVILRPGTFDLMLAGNRRLFGFDLKLQQVKGWLDDLIQLVQLAEKQSPPQVTTELTLAERSAQELRHRNPYLELWVGIGLSLFFLVVGALVFAAVFLFASATGGL